MTKALGLASLASGLLSLIATLYVSSVRFFHKYVLPSLRDNITIPMTMSIIATVGAKNITEFKENLVKTEKEVEKDEEFREKYL
jgi:hypothetical protein